MHFPEGDWRVRGWLPRSPKRCPSWRSWFRSPCLPYDPLRGQKGGPGTIFLSPTRSLSPSSFIGDQELDFFFLKLPQFEPIIWGEVSVTTVSVSVCGTVSVFYTLPSPRAPSSSDRVPAPAASPPGPLELAAPAPVRSPSGLPACLPPAPSRCPRSQPLAGAERAAPRGPRAPAEQLPCRPQVLT